MSDDAGQYTNVHIDTSVLFPLICASPDPDQFRACNNLVNRCCNGVCQTTISQVTLGELLTQLYETYDEEDGRQREKDQYMMKIVSFLNKHNVSTPPFPIEGLSIVQSVVDVNYGFLQADAFIIAHALQDRRSIKFLTLDGPTIKYVSRLGEVETRLREDGLREHNLAITGPEYSTSKRRRNY